MCFSEPLGRTAAATSRLISRAVSAAQNRQTVSVARCFTCILVLRPLYWALSTSRRWVDIWARKVISFLRPLFKRLELTLKHTTFRLVASSANVEQSSLCILVVPVREDHRHPAVSSDKLVSVGHRVQLNDTSGQEIQTSGQVHLRSDKRSRCSQAG